MGFFVYVCVRRRERKPDVPLDLKRPSIFTTWGQGGCADVTFLDSSFLLPLTLLFLFFFSRKGAGVGKLEAGRERGCLAFKTTFPLPLPLHEKNTNNQKSSTTHPPTPLNPTPRPANPMHPSPSLSFPLPGMAERSVSIPSSVFAKKPQPALVPVEN